MTPYTLLPFFFNFSRFWVIFWVIFLDFGSFFYSEIVTFSVIDTFFFHKIVSIRAYALYINVVQNRLPISRTNSLPPMAFPETFKQPSNEVSEEPCAKNLQRSKQLKNSRSETYICKEIIICW